MIAFSRAVSFDVVVTMTIAWALAFFLAAELELDLKSRRRFLIGFYIAIGLSLLAKGFVGFVIPFGVIGAYYTLRGKAPARDLRLSILWGLPLSLAIAAVWYGPMFWKHGELFFNEFIIRHHFQRYATNKYRHPAAIYYYLEILPLLALPWSAFLVDGILKARKAFWNGSDDPVNKLQTFALAWIFLPLVFFSLSGSKLPGYILPVLPAVALIAGVRLTQFDGEPKSKWAIKATGGLALVFAIGARFRLAFWENIRTRRVSNGGAQCDRRNSCATFATALEDSCDDDCCGDFGNRISGFAFSCARIGRG